MEVLDPREGRWQTLSMQAPRSSCGVSALQDKLYAVGSVTACRIVFR